ncbi:hypothetical protein [Microbacterium elymi]|uniref:GGDEF domain-containing protein n=1 Tax=Microbacterium elymi TaxID=2909587 RepID=A0ABY5NNI9_9MICO|nr:hypothetical protein [Microbacterium elymi]UUT36753.1 hypothetical protein L2X98_33965 [Microbacterium elymi]
MILLDQVTLSAVTALVVVVSGIYFIIETFARRDEGAGRVWSLGFLGAMLTSLSYMVWAADPAITWGVVIGNGTFVAGTGCMWLGCRRFNARRMTVTALVVGVAAVGASVAVLAAGPEGGAWAGALWMFVCLMVFAGLGAGESLRGEMGRYRTARALAAVLGLQSLFYVGRTIVALLAGFDSPLFQTMFGTAVTSVLTVILTIVALVVTSVLRADRAVDRGPLLTASVSLLGTEGVLPHGSFLRLLDQALARASGRGEQIAVIAVRVEDLPQIASAFGAETARAVAEACRASVVRNVPALALVGEDGRSGLLLALRALSEPDARRQGAIVSRGLVDDLGGVSGASSPWWASASGCPGRAPRTRTRWWPWHVRPLVAPPTPSGPRS